MTFCAPSIPDKQLKNYLKIIFGIYFNRFCISLSKFDLYYINHESYEIFNDIHNVERLTPRTI